MKATWLTDIHLNFLSQHGRQRFYDELNKENTDIILITGDIAEAPSIVNILSEMAEMTDKLIYFVAGNHDYYHGNINDVRGELPEIKGALWLNWASPIILGDGIWLAGVDGWADGQNGNFDASSVELNDAYLIEELKAARCKGRKPMQKKMHELAAADTWLLKDKLRDINTFSPKKIIVLTHIPPFPETALYAGKISDDDFLPFFTNKTMGDMLLEFATEHPNIELSVLCGHSHSKAHYQPLPNLNVRCGAAEYLCPEIQVTCDISEL